MRTLYHDEAGFIISAELVLVATICVLSLVVGLTEVASAVNQELNDCGEAFGSLNQSFCFQGFSVFKNNCHAFNHFSGSSFVDHIDDCDRNECSISCAPPTPEMPKHH